MLNEKTISAMLADVQRAQDTLARPMHADNGAPRWIPGHAAACSGLEYVRAKLADELIMQQGAEYESNY